MIYCAYCIRPKERPVKRRLCHSQTIVSRLLRCRFDALRAYYVLMPAALLASTVLQPYYNE